MTDAPGNGSSTVTCPRCGAQNVGDRWCSECGLNLIVDYDAPKSRKKLAVALICAAVVLGLVAFVFVSKVNIFDGNDTASSQADSVGAIQEEPGSAADERSIIPGVSLGPARMGMWIGSLVAELGPPKMDGATYVWAIGGGKLRVSADSNQQTVGANTDSEAFDYEGITLETPYREVLRRIPDWTNFECEGYEADSAQIVLNETQYGPSTSWSYLRDPSRGFQGFEVSISDQASLENCVD